MSSGASRKKIVVLGMMTKMPVAGVVWQTVHYLLGLERLGYEAWYVEAHARTPSMLMEREDDDGTARAAAFIDRVLRRFDLGGRWAYHALHDDGRCYGMSRRELESLYRSAELIVNLHGGTRPLPEHSATQRLVYLETDPVQLQIELDEGVQESVDFLEPHIAFFTFAESYGRPDCLLPVSPRFQFQPTRQPVVLDLWAGGGRSHRNLFTTVGNWQQNWRSVEYRGETYSWSKHEQFLKFLDLPQRSGVRFELALSSYVEEDRALLEGHGWSVRPGLDVSREIDPYREYICSSKGEFTVAKDQNVRLRSGWFSDRSATYLAAGRPVVTQDTGFGAVLPTGEGLFAVTGTEEAVEALARVEADYERHAAAASDVARGFFDAERVLSDLLERTGVGLGRVARPSPTGEAPSRPGLPDGLRLTVTSRRPTTLTTETTAEVLTRPIPGWSPARPLPPASLVVVTYNGLAFTKMCMETLLTTEYPVADVVVVDNASADGTPDYLRRLADRCPVVRPVLNCENRGFAAAANQGLERAGGELLVLLNNDVLVAPGWLSGLSRHLGDEAVGLIGPVTNAAGNEAQLATEYETFGEFLRFAARRGGEHEGRRLPIPVLNMFCVAMRRGVYEQVGPLDERFEVGLFEDDDYAVRVRAKGYEVACAEDVFVHHFGEAAFGHLVPTGSYSAVFETNRRRFEDKWAVQWRTHARRSDPEYRRLLRQVRDAVDSAVTPGAPVLVVSRGDEELLNLRGGPAAHFPAGDDGQWSGYHPADSAEAISRLDAAAAGGARYLVIPKTSLWWLEHYGGFRNHLERVHRRVFEERDTCVVYELRSQAARP